MRQEVNLWGSNLGIDCPFLKKKISSLVSIWIFASFGESVCVCVCVCVFVCVLVEWEEDGLGKRCGMKRCC